MACITYFLAGTVFLLADGSGQAGPALAGPHFKINQICQFLMSK